jgi:hypothetical protein
LGVKRAQLVRSTDGHVKRTSWNDRKITTVKWQSRETAKASGWYGCGHVAAGKPGRMPAAALGRSIFLSAIFLSSTVAARSESD